MFELRSPKSSRFWKGSTIRSTTDQQAPGSLDSRAKRPWPFRLGYHHHHHVVPLERISLTLSRHFFLTFIASGRSSGLHPVSSNSYCMYVQACCPALAWPYAGVHRSTSLMSSSFFLQQCPSCLSKKYDISFIDSKNTTSRSPDFRAVKREVENTYKVRSIFSWTSCAYFFSFQWTCHFPFRFCLLPFSSRPSDAAPIRVKEKIENAVNW